MCCYRLSKEGPIVMVRMLGACAGCAMSAQTMTMGIEKLVMQKFPEVQRVISVWWHGAETHIIIVNITYKKNKY